MNISYKWLKRYIDFDLEPKALAATLTSLGLECDSVEEVESIRGGLRGVVIGKVLTCVDHPDSDHLHITTVDLGDGNPVQIVCGAPNVAAGQTVVVATVGTTLYDGDKEFQIKKSKIRGQESFGMICAEDELNLGASHDGIMVLPDDVPAGTPAAEYFNVQSDYCLEVELTPNRVDAASHYGVARDLKAWLWRNEFEKNPEAPLTQIHRPSVDAFKVDRAEGAIAVQVENTAACPRYAGVTVRGVKVTESPEWLRNALLAIGQRPINNVVDITNFILHGMGQPLHAFDLAKVKGDRIVVRTCPAGTEFTTLDGVKRTLHQDDLMICNAEEPMCIAGVFGGLDAGVTESTTDVFIESAWFNSTSVRRTARRHGLSTDASFRYERGTDPEICLYAAKLAALLIQEVAGGEVCGEPVDLVAAPIERASFDFSLPYCNTLIGKEIPTPLVETILHALEIETAPAEEADTLKVTVPPYRVDVTRPCDVVEEVLRVYGYNNVEFDTRVNANLSTKGATDFSYQMQEIISGMLTGAGCVEILNNSLSAQKYYAENERWPEASCVRVINPLSGDLSLMRRTLLYGGLETAAHNINRKAADLRLYEFGNVYEFNPEAPSTPEAPLTPYKETPMLGMWITGQLNAASWNRKAAEADVFDLKALVLDVLRRLGVTPDAISMTQFADAVFAPGLRITHKNGKELATLGLISRKTLKAFDIEQPLAYAELQWKTLMRLAQKHQTLYTELPKTQPVRRDLALLLDKQTSFDQVEKAVRKAERKLLREVSLFDVYEGKNLPEGKKSYAIAITLQDAEKTLNDRKIDDVMRRVVETLKRELNAELR